MEEQKLRMKPALKQQTNVQRIKSIAVWYSLKFVFFFKICCKEGATQM